MHRTSIDKIGKMRICVINNYIPIITIRNLIATITYNAAYISIAGYRSTVSCVSNMRVAKRRTNNTANYAAAGNTAADKRHIINISIMRNTKQTNISFTFSINS